jgi:small subunit ribosomal protein S6
MAEPLPKHRAREYETIFIVNPESSLDTIDQVAGKVTDVIDKLEGKLLKAENWGRRRLAYPVKKQPQGYYLYLRYLGYSDLVHEIERNFRMMESVLKYLTVKIDEDVDPAARPVNEADISFVPHIEEAPEPEPTADLKPEDMEEAEDGEDFQETSSDDGDEPETDEADDDEDDEDDEDEAGGASQDEAGGASQDEAGGASQDEEETEAQSAADAAPEGASETSDDNTEAPVADEPDDEPQGEAEETPDTTDKEEA